MINGRHLIVSIALLLVLIPHTYAYVIDTGGHVEFGEVVSTEGTITTQYFGVIGNFQEYFGPPTSVTIDGLAEGYRPKSVSFSTHGGFQVDNSNLLSSSSQVTFSDGVNTYGYGTISCLITPPTQYIPNGIITIRINFENFEYSGAADSLTLALNYDQAAINTPRVKDNAAKDGISGFEQRPGRVLMTFGPTSSGDRYPSNYQESTSLVPPWSATFEYGESESGDYITFHQTDNIEYTARISNQTHLLTTANVLGTTSVTKQITPASRPYNVDVLARGIWYNATLFGPPTDPETYVTLYGEAYNIYTGSPVPGVEISISHPQIGRTLQTTTGATGGYTAAGIFPDQATTIAANAPNYYNSSILFDVAPRYTEWYVPLFLLPVEPPTPPENTTAGKSLVYGYLVSQDTQRPISGATVSLAGYGSKTTTSTGYYYFNNVEPGTPTISASAAGHDTLTESVTVEADTPTLHNLALTGHYTLKVSVKDANSLKILTNATTISLSDGQERNEQNPVTFPVKFGTYTISAGAEGYYPTQQYQYVDQVGETSVTILLTPKAPPTPPPEMPNYPPHNVRFHCIDDYGGPLANVSVTAAYLETTSPWSWFKDLLGIPSTVAINETTLAGTTGTDGSITFSMVETVRYAITAHDPASNLTVDFTLYPQETQYTIQFRTRPPAEAETYPLYELEAVPLEGDTQVSLRLAYMDRDNATTSLLFWVKDSAGEYVHTESLEPKYLNWTNTSYTVENRPTSYTWGFDANHATAGEISAARSITLHGSGRLVDLGFEDDFWYLLLSAVWIVAIAAIFSGSRVRFGAIIIPLIGGGVPTLIGWLPPATAALIGILTFIGVFAYMRKSEYKLYR